MTATGTAAYAAYASELASIWPRLGDVRGQADVLAALDGRASAALRSLVPVEARRSAGAFFSPLPVKAAVADALRAMGAAPYSDPACGAGDLLLAAASVLSIEDSAQATWAAWSQVLRGVDVEREFVKVARQRLALAVLERHGFPSGLARPRQSEMFLRVRTADGLQALRPNSVEGTIVMNPPFGVVDAPPRLAWGSGKVPRAGVFLDAAVHALRPGARIAAVLPDVLRSGARASHLRKIVESRLEIGELKPLGQFDRWTDVDVFLLVGERRQTLSEASSADWIAPAAGMMTLEDRFDVRVGPVVHYRDAKTGPEHPFITSQNLPTEGVVDTIHARRRYGGVALAPPFVVLRRTDRPSRLGRRARAVVVDLEGPVFVENHLLVLSPKDGSRESCDRLARSLGTIEVTEWLDSAIRCRHLTVGAVKSIPLDW